jgi:hypothetical protein
MLDRRRAMSLGRECIMLPERPTLCTRSELRTKNAVGSADPSERTVGYGEIDVKAFLEAQR